MYKAEFNFLIKNKNVYSAIYELIIIAECNYNYVTKIKFWYKKIKRKKSTQ